MRSAWPLALLLTAALSTPDGATAQILNEVMLSPGTTDWNQDGSVDAFADEYVEIVNLGVREVDLGFWTLSDLVQVRHTFPNGTILRPGGVIVVFGGGAPAPSIPGVVVVASSGSLALNNAGETLSLRNGANTVDAATFAAATAGKSFNRDPEGSPAADFALHDLLPAASGDGSPGLRATQEPFTAPAGTLPFINEWLPNATTLANDWNGDGVAFDGDDEFVEIVNPPNGTSIDIGGWTLGDGATLFHNFAAGTVLAPGASVVVVAGAPVGIPGLAVDGQSWGALSNSADLIDLRDELGDVVSHVSYESDEPDIAWNRDPDADPSTPFFALHYDLAPNFARSSPGRRVDGSPFPTPEPDAAAFSAVAALAGVARARASRRSRREAASAAAASARGCSRRRCSS